MLHSRNEGFAALSCYEKMVILSPAKRLLLPEIPQYRP